MNEEWKEKWCAALESDEFEQGQYCLKNITGEKPKYCCWGVLCELHPNVEWIPSSVKSREVALYTSPDGRFTASNESFPHFFEELLDISFSDMKLLAAMNDGMVIEQAPWQEPMRYDFHAIAKHIRKNL